MEMNHFVNISVQENSQIAEARRVAMSFATAAEFSELEAGKLAIALTEAATNQIKHAGGGSILIRSAEHQGIKGVEVIAIDKGPGMANTQANMRDGYSTSGTSGSGLGAMERQSGYFEIYSYPAKGTAVLMQFWASPLLASVVPRRTEIGGVAIPIKGETECGDGWAVKQFIDSVLLLVADGLGHGAMAAEASGEARRLFNQQSETVPANILKTLHLGMKSTRGAAGAIVEANAETGVIRYAGVGNTQGFIMGSQNPRSMVSLNGTLGAQAHKIQEFVYEWPADALLVFTSDGITSQPSIKDYPGLAQRHPTLIAAVLYRDFNRVRDDATVVVVKRKAA